MYVGYGGKWVGVLTLRVRVGESLYDRLPDELFRRLGGVIDRDVLPEFLAIDCDVQASYCIDAPDVMPAGACVYEHVTERIGGALQTTVVRD